MPELGSGRSFKHPMLQNIRMLSVHAFDRYLIFYREYNGEVEVIRVIHAARDLPMLFAEQ